MTRRPTIDGKRWVRFLVCVTIYSESGPELKATLDGVFDNLVEFSKVGIC